MSLSHKKIIFNIFYAIIDYWCDFNSLSDRIKKLPLNPIGGFDEVFSKF